MLKAREILRLKWQQCRSHRQIATAQGVGVGTPSDIVDRARRAGITCWQEVEPLSEEELEARLYPTPSTIAPRPLPSPASIHIELRRKGVTLRLLHEEYFLANPNGYGYTKFVELYNEWAERQRVTMRQVHKAWREMLRRLLRAQADDRASAAG